jgi:hypothetical protein
VRGQVLGGRTQANTWCVNGVCIKPTCPPSSSATPTRCFLLVPAPVRPPVHLYVCTHARTHAQTQTDTHTYTCMYTHSHTHTHSLTRKHMHIHSFTHTGAVCETQTGCSSLCKVRWRTTEVRSCVRVRARRRASFAMTTKQGLSPPANAPQVASMAAALKQLHFFLGSGWLLDKDSWPYFVPSAFNLGAVDAAWTHSRNNALFCNSCRAPTVFLPLLADHVWLSWTNTHTQTEGERQRQRQRERDAHTHLFPPPPQHTPHAHILRARQAGELGNSPRCVSPKKRPTSRLLLLSQLDVLREYDPPAKLGLDLRRLSVCCVMFRDVCTVRVRVRARARVCVMCVCCVCRVCLPCSFCVRYWQSDFLALGRRLHDEGISLGRATAAAPKVQTRRKQ